MLRRIFRYFFPPLRLNHPSKHISAQFAPDLNAKQAIVMEAGLARDPTKAQAVWDKLYKKHGDKTYRYIVHYLKRRKRISAKKRFLMLMQHIVGEKEHSPRKPKKQLARVLPTYKFEE